MSITDSVNEYRHPLIIPNSLLWNIPLSQLTQTDGMLCTKLIVECYIIAACKKHDKNFLCVPVLAATLRQCLCYDKNMDNLGGPVIDKVL